MSRKAKARSQPKFEHLMIGVTDYEASVSGSVSSAFSNPNFIEFGFKEQPAFEFQINLTMSGTILDSDTRSGHELHLSLIGNDESSLKRSGTLKEYQIYDESEGPVFKTFRGRRIPVLEPPKGIGFIDKVRGEKTWNGFVFTSRSFVAQTLQLLQADRDLFIVLTEKTHDRTRAIQYFSIQTEYDR